ncbi:TolC family protein [Carboxylicivirga sp. N1Y90]|uniref:TolC family protein n=1 Tax=Carboxylicivirga fragile TaxID=3417571 RepID=UPI003D346E9A|nr:TolC family protein [Marinilabiliaceae bacterium N1Y90]
MRKILFTILLIIICTPNYAQNSVIDTYVLKGIESNLVLQQRELALQSSILKLREARGLFMPQVNFSSRLTMNKGGRSFEFPIGDLVNPIYQSLNALTQSQFPTMGNQSFQLMPEEEQEAKLSVYQPVYNRSLILNNKIQKEAIGISEAELLRYRQTLTFQIKEAYYNVLRSKQILDLVESTKALVNENLRVSQKLLENDVVTKEVVLRSRTEVNRIELNETEAQKGFQLAINYLNFLTNQPLDTPIEIVESIQLGLLPNVGNAEELALDRRSELKQITHQVNSVGYLAKMHQAENLPNVSLVGDYGYLSQDYHFNNNNDFFSGSVVLNWTLFKGTVNKQKKAQAKLQQQQLVLAKQDLQNGIRLEVKESILEMKRQNTNVSLNKTRSIEASEVYRISEKKYRLGELSLIELIDARTNMTEAEFTAIISKFDYMLSMAKYEYVTASFNPQ